MASVNQEHKRSRWEIPNYSTEVVTLFGNVHQGRDWSMSNRGNRIRVSLVLIVQCLMGSELLAAAFSLSDSLNPVSGQFSAYPVTIDSNGHERALGQIDFKINGVRNEVVARYHYLWTGTEEVSLLAFSGCTIFDAKNWSCNRVKFEDGFPICRSVEVNFYIVDDKATLHNFDATKGSIKYQEVRDLSNKMVSRLPYIIERRPVLSGQRIRDARVQLGSAGGGPSIAISLDSVGAKEFERITMMYRLRRLAIVMDDKVLSAPTIREAVTGGEVTVTGQFTVEEARNLVTLLRAEYTCARLNGSGWSREKINYPGIDLTAHPVRFSVRNGDLSEFDSYPFDMRQKKVTFIDWWKWKLLLLLQ